MDQFVSRFVFVGPKSVRVCMQEYSKENLFILHAGYICLSDIFGYRPILNRIIQFRQTKDAKPMDNEYTLCSEHVFGCSIWCSPKYAYYLMVGIEPLFYKRLLEILGQYLNIVETDNTGFRDVKTLCSDFGFLDQLATSDYKRMDKQIEVAYKTKYLNDPVQRNNKNVYGKCDVDWIFNLLNPKIVHKIPRV